MEVTEPDRMSKQWLTPGVVVLIIFAAPWFCCCAMPYAGSYLAHGRGFIGNSDQDAIKPGMTRADVLASIGKPYYVHQRDHEHEVWHYHAEPFGTVVFCIYFNADGCVESAHAAD